MEIKDRAFVSFDGYCPYKCKHCFSFEIERTSMPRTIEQIVDSLSSAIFDVVYVSQRKENFIDADNGLLLCEKLFSKYACSIVIITRNVFNHDQINRLLLLQKRMQQEGKFLFVGVSVIGLESSTVSEDLSIIPTPDKRIEFATTLHGLGIPALVMIRPLFPKLIIPSHEWKRIIDRVAGSISCVLSGPLLVNDQILKRLGIASSDATLLSNANSEYLDGAMAENMKTVDVRQELEELSNYCSLKGVPFFTHSLPAINYLARLISLDNSLI